MGQKTKKRQERKRDFFRMRKAPQYVNDNLLRKEMKNGAVFKCDVREADSLVFMCEAWERFALTLMMKCAGHTDRSRWRARKEKKKLLFHCHVAGAFVLLFAQHSTNFIKIMWIINVGWRNKDFFSSFFFYYCCAASWNLFRHRKERISVCQTTPLMTHPRAKFCLISPPSSSAFHLISSHKFCFRRSPT